MKEGGSIHAPKEEKEHIYSHTAFANVDCRGEKKKHPRQVLKRGLQNSQRVLPNQMLVTAFHVS